MLKTITLLETGLKGLIWYYIHPFTVQGQVLTEQKMFSPSFVYQAPLACFPQVFPQPLQPLSPSANKNNLRYLSRVTYTYSLPRKELEDLHKTHQLCVWGLFKYPSIISPRVIIWSNF